MSCDNCKNISKFMQYSLQEPTLFLFNITYLLKVLPLLSRNEKGQRIEIKTFSDYIYS